MFKFLNLLINSIIFTLLIANISSCTYADNNILNSDFMNSGTITNNEINEASGIAVSRIHEDIVWVINDSGNSPLVFAVNSKGEHIASLKIKGVKNNDWEDMASFNYKGKPYILIADVGDNRAKRKKYFLHIIQEPDIKKYSHTSPVPIKPSWSITFTYEDGPRDCESVAVDIINEKILLLSKRDRPPVLYELPLNKRKNIVAKRRGLIKSLPKPTQNDIRLTKYFNYTTRPTAMDISEDGLSAVILTYANAYYFNLEDPGDWLSAFLTHPKEIILPFLNQAESVCFGKDATSIYVTTEKIPAPLLKIDLAKLFNMKK